MNDDENTLPDVSVITEYLKFTITNNILYFVI